MKRDKLFISYRRDDAPHQAARLYERMAKRFGKKRVFMDIDTIHHGFDFVEILPSHLNKTKVMLVVIGPEWARLTGADGRRRLENKDDFVRLEVAEALKSAAAVIPVLVDGAQMPRAEDLPDDIARLRLRQAVELRRDHFASDMDLLERSVAAILGGGGLLRRIAAVLLVAALIIGAWASYPLWRELLSGGDELAAVAKTAPASLGDLEPFRDCDGCPEMVVIPGGDFMMGSPDDEDGRRGNEGPQRQVTVPRFAIGKYEITFDDWAACVSDGYCQSNTSPSDSGWGRGKRPVINVSWEDITGDRGFLDWLNAKVEGAPYRLPTEAEWEYAARAGTQTRFSFGDDDGALGDHAWFGGNSGGKTHPVRGKRPNPWGIYDMHGNVWEWTQDCWNSSYAGAPGDGSAWRSGDCSRPILRGGSWLGDPWGLRAAYRVRLPRDLRSSDLGFRVARTIIPR